MTIAALIASAMRITLTSLNCRRAIGPSLTRFKVRKTMSFLGLPRTNLFLLDLICCIGENQRYSVTRVLVNIIRM